MKNEQAKINLPPKPSYVCIDENYGRIIGYDFKTQKPIHEGKWIAKLYPDTVDAILKSLSRS